MRIAPLVESARQVGEVPLGSGYRALLFDEITASGAVRYAALLAVVEESMGESVFFVASEVNTLAEVFGGGSHYLGVFDGEGHTSRGSSDEWGDPERFFPEALRIARERFGGSDREDMEPTSSAQP